MADRSWVGGTGTWDATTTTNWSATSGGAGGASAPTTADNVFFNSASNATLYTVTVTGTASCADMTMAGPASGNVTWAGNGTMNVAGSMTVAATGVTRTSFGNINFTATTTGKTLTVGISLSGVAFNGAGGGWTLGSAFNVGVITMFLGTLNTSAVGNYSITCSGITASGLGAASLVLNASTVNITGNGNIILSGGGLTFNAGTSQINITFAGITLTSKGLTFYNVAFTGAGSTTVTNTISGVNTFNNLAFTGPTLATAQIVLFSANQTINGTLSGSGASEIRRISYRSDVIGTARTLTLANPATLTNCDFRDITAVTNAITATGGGNCGGNTNVTGFPAAKTVYWNLAGTQNWSATGWATSSGGSPAAANFPLAQDTAVFDNTGSAGTVNGGSFVSYNLPGIDMSTRTSAMTLSFSTNPAGHYGSLLLGSGVTFAYTGTMSFVGRGNTQQILGNATPFAVSITVQNNGGTVQLAGAVTLGATNLFTLTSGTLDLQSYTLTAGSFATAGSVTRVFAFGTGNLTLTGTSGTVLSTSTNGFTASGTRTVNITNNTATTINVVSGATTEAAALDINILAGTYVLNLGSTPGIRNLDFTGFSGSCTLSGFTTLVYGNLTLSATATYPASTGTMQFAATSSGKTITTNGKTLDFAVAFNGVGGTWALQDALTMGSSRTLTHTNGTINLNGKTLTVGTAYTTATGTKNLTFNSGTLICPTAATTAFNNAVPTGFTTTAGTGTGTISMTAATAKTFVGGGSTFNCTLNQGGAGALTITGANTFNNITNTVQPASVLFTAGTTNTFSNFNLNGTAGNLITIASVTAATHTLSKSSGTVSCDYLSITNSIATGGAAWYAGVNSTNVSGNTGWIFAAPGGGVNVNVTGQSATGSVGIGTVVASARAPPTGVSATATIDGVGVSAGGSISVDPNDTAGFGLLGTVQVASGARVSVTGISASGAVGTVQVASGARVSVTGVSASGDVGTVTVVIVVNALVAVTGVSASGDIGTADATGKASVTLTGVSASGAVGTVTTRSSYYVTGVSATASLGSVVISAGAKVSVTGVQATGSITSVLVWGQINDNQTPNWVDVNDSQSVTWSAISDTQTPNWQVVNDAQTVTWVQVSDGNTVTWVQIPT